MKKYFVYVNNVLVWTASDMAEAKEQEKYFSNHFCNVEKTAIIAKEW